MSGINNQGYLFKKSSVAPEKSVAFIHVGIVSHLGKHRTSEMDKNEHGITYK